MVRSSVPPKKNQFVIVKKIYDIENFALIGHHSFAMTYIFTGEIYGVF